MRLVTKGLFLAILSLLITGCASARLMPTKTTFTIVPWTDYEEAAKLYESVKPHQTTLADLKKLKFDPDRMPNVKLLRPSDVSNIFYNNQGGTQPRVPPEIQDCLSIYTECRGLEFSLTDVKDRGIGNIWLRWLKFKKENEITGSEVVFQFFLKRDLVVYKQLGGTPNIHKLTREKNPLGPLQEPFDLIMKYSPTP